MPDWFTLTWGKDIQPNSLPGGPVSWVSGDKLSVGLVQRQNGPVVLAVINSVLIQVLIENKKAHFGADLLQLMNLAAAIHK